ncbi:MAG: tetratricopeptide repeat protein [Planctomycetota bacterium]|nr:tetratricopeptide repeat protein [Planctomycetota bacterium]
MFGLASLAAPGPAQELGPEERAEIDRMRRRGELADALEALDEVLEEEPGDAWSLATRGLIRFERCEYEAALADVGRALAQADQAVANDAELTRAARALAGMQVELGRASDALATLAGAGAAIDPDTDARDAWIVGSAALAAGERERALEAFRRGGEASGPKTWEGLLARARCQRRLGFFERAARTLVEADVLAEKSDGIEPDVLAELGGVYLEVYGELRSAMSSAHLPSKQYKEALTLHPEHEGARLGLLAVHRLNWLLRRTSPPEILAEILDARPDSIRGLLAGVSMDLDDGRLRSARASLQRLEELAPGRRDVRAEGAALAWIEHDRERAQAILAALVEGDPGDSVPERIVAEHLNELYRYAEAMPFAERAVERDGGDWLAWTQLGRARANTGDEDGAREALARAEEVAEGRANAWRTNTARVLTKMDREYTERTFGEHTFLWKPDAAPVLEVYLPAFYQGEREELARRYGFTPGPVRIEVFRRWGDFSVRSTGFEGFSALGVCFGPVVTSVSPLSQLRGSFSWARTAYHEYTHVIHLGLSHNRCPRWITEGLATWEEEEKNLAWSRNMRFDLVNAHANGRIIPVRELNRAFRGPRILFAYYQGGLLCRMLIEDYGFSPIIRLLEAFDRGFDLDQAFHEVYGITPEEVDERFLAFVGDLVAPLRIEPVWTPELVMRKRLALAKEPPAEEEAQRRWAEDWCTVASGHWQRGRRIDAEAALRHVEAAGELPPRGWFLRGQLAYSRASSPEAARGEGAQREALEDARRAFERGLAAGGEDYRVRLALGQIVADRGELDQAEAHLLAAERCFPGFSGPLPSAELLSAELYERRGRREDSMRARMRWLAYNAGDDEHRLIVAGWLDEEGRPAESVRYYAEANEVDPFRRQLHLRWGKALAALGRHEQALREFDVALRVPWELDVEVGPEVSGPTDPRAAAAGGDVEASRRRWSAKREAWRALEPEIRGWKALELLELGRAEEARTLAAEALAADPDCEAANEVMRRLPD